MKEHEYEEISERILYSHTHTHSPSFSYYFIPIVQVCVSSLSNLHQIKLDFFRFSSTQHIKRKKRKEDEGGKTLSIAR